MALKLLWSLIEAANLESETCILTIHCFELWILAWCMCLEIAACAPIKIGTRTTLQVSALTAVQHATAIVALNTVHGRQDAWENWGILIQICASSCFIKASVLAWAFQEIGFLTDSYCIRAVFELRNLSQAACVISTLASFLREKNFINLEESFFIIDK